MPPVEGGVSVCYIDWHGGKYFLTRVFGEGGNRVLRNYSMTVWLSILALAVLTSCDGTTTGGAAPPPPGCAGGAVVYDTGGTNGYGRQSAVDSGQVTAPTDLAFVPGAGAAFIVTEQAGYAAYFNGGCTVVNRVDLRTLAGGGIGVVSGGEQGLLNIEFHPDYASNGHVFFYHTSVDSAVNSITRMTATFPAGVLTLSDPQRIIDFRKAATAVASNHNGGGMVFAPDNSLLASIGDGGDDNSTAQADTRLLGKVIRILPNLAVGAGGYTIPAGNMFAAGNLACSDVAVSAQDCPEILAKGLRNPFRMARDGDIIYLGDVGSSTEEINSFNYTVSTVNFGWPTYDGYVALPSLPGYRNPIVYYERTDATADAFRTEDPMGTASGAASVMIGDVYRGNRYSAALNGGALLFGEFYDGYIRAVGVDASGAITDADAAPGFHLVHAGAISSMVQGPDGYLYLTALYGPAAVYRLVRP
jgi:glucose/arabinose dehydrogenase